MFQSNSPPCGSHLTALLLCLPKRPIRMFPRLDDTTTESIIGPLHPPVLEHCDCYGQSMIGTQVHTRSRSFTVRLVCAIDFDDTIKVRRQKSCFRISISHHYGCMKSSIISTLICFENISHVGVIPLRGSHAVIVNVNQLSTLLCSQ